MCWPTGIQRTDINYPVPAFSCHVSVQKALDGFTKYVSKTTVPLCNFSLSSKIFDMSETASYI